MSGPDFSGIFAATVVPMRADYAVDEPALSRHVAEVAAVQGIRGLLINGHAGENFLTTSAEKRRVVELCRASVARDTLLIAGVNAESSTEAAAQAAAAAAAGADAVLIFPPNSWALGPHPDTVLRHHQFCIDACELPIMLYQAPVGAGGMAYGPELLAALVQMPRVVGIKEGSWEVAAYEANRRLVKAQAPQVAVMASGDEHLLSSFVLGSDGSQVSLAVIIPQVIVALDAAVRADDMITARRMHDIIYPLAKAIYGTVPGSFATARLKVLLHLLGRIPDATARPPLGPLPEAEVAALQGLLAGIA